MKRGGATIWPRYFKGCNDLFTIVEYAVANKIAKEPAFVWSVRKALRGD